MTIEARDLILGIPVPFRRHPIADRDVLPMSPSYIADAQRWPTELLTSSRLVRTGVDVQQPNRAAVVRYDKNGNVFEITPFYKTGIDRARITVRRRFHGLFTTELHWKR